MHECYEQYSGLAGFAGVIAGDGGSLAVKVAMAHAEPARIRILGTAAARPSRKWVVRGIPADIATRGQVLSALRDRAGWETVIVDEVKYEAVTKDHVASARSVGPPPALEFACGKGVLVISEKSEPKRKAPGEPQPSVAIASAPAGSADQPPALAKAAQRPAWESGIANLGAPKQRRSPLVHAFAAGATGAGQPPGAPPPGHVGPQPQPGAPPEPGDTAMVDAPPLPQPPPPQPARSQLAAGSQGPPPAVRELQQRVDALEGRLNELQGTVTEVGNGQRELAGQVATVKTEMAAGRDEFKTFMDQGIVAKLGEALQLFGVAAPQAGARAGSAGKRPAAPLEEGAARGDTARREM